MSGNRAMRRALQTADAIRVNAELPLITDVTELITPDVAKEILKQNKHNRPVNWKQVEEYAALMKRGEFKLTAQGIVIDKNGNLLTGQTRLWAVILSECRVYMRVSRGHEPETAIWLDRGRQQSARDLATRQTEKRHSPSEASIARAISVLNGNMKPSKDELGAIIVKYAEAATALLKDNHGLKKSKSVLMILAAICMHAETIEDARRIGKRTKELADQLEAILLPHSASECWGRGAAFGLAMEHARRCVEGNR